jgi:hypothetical protein
MTMSSVVEHVHVTDLVAFEPPEPCLSGILSEYPTSKIIILAFDELHVVLRPAYLVSAKRLRIYCPFTGKRLYPIETQHLSSCSGKTLNASLLVKKGASVSIHLQQQLLPNKRSEGKPGERGCRFTHLRRQAHHGINTNRFACSTTCLPC